jgi:hypothetical protein
MNITNLLVERRRESLAILSGKALRSSLEIISEPLMRGDLLLTLERME